jgi:hypothetical protein
MLAATLQVQPLTPADATRLIDKDVTPSHSDFQPELRASSASLTAMLIGGELTPAGRQFRFRIADAAGGADRDLVVDDVDRIDEIRFFRERLLILGVDGHQQRVVIVVEGRTASQLRQFPCSGLAVTPDFRFLHCRRGTSGARVAFDVATLRFVLPADVVADVLARLRQDDLDQKGLAVQRLTDVSQLAPINEPIRQALAVELQRRLVEDRALAAARARHESVEAAKAYVARRHYFADLLVPLAAQLGDARYAPLLVRADASSIRGFLTILARAGLADAGLRAIEAAWTEPTPPGYADWYRANLISSMARYAEGQHPLEPSMRSRIGSLCQRALTSPENWRTVREAMLLADEIDDDASIDVIRASVDNDHFRELGIHDPAALNELNIAAVRILSRRLALPAR